MILATGATWAICALATAGVEGTAATGTILAFASNLMNTLPAGLIAGTAVAQAHPPRPIVDGLLIGIDLGPNLSITGSLATILWLRAIRREGEDVGFRRFLKVGSVTMIPALAAALAFAAGIDRAVPACPGPSLPSRAGRGILLS